MAVVIILFLFFVVLCFSFKPCVMLWLLFVYKIIFMCLLLALLFLYVSFRYIAHLLLALKLKTHKILLISQMLLNRISLFCMRMGFIFWVFRFFYDRWDLRRMRNVLTGGSKSPIGVFLCANPKLFLPHSLTRCPSKLSAYATGCFSFSGCGNLLTYVCFAQEVGHIRKTLHGCVIWSKAVKFVLRSCYVCWLMFFLKNVQKMVFLEFGHHFPIKFMKFSLYNVWWTCKNGQLTELTLKPTLSRYFVTLNYRWTSWDP